LSQSGSYKYSLQVQNEYILSKFNGRVLNDYKDFKQKWSSILQIHCADIVGLYNVLMVPYKALEKDERSGFNQRKDN
jgi:hypothetical protein